VPFVRPVTVQGLAEHVAEPPGVPVTVNPVIAEPPSMTGGVQLTVAHPPPGTADTPVGAVGTVAGMTDGDAVDCAPLPTLFVASTVKVYGVPFVKPVTVHGLDEHDTEPEGEPVTV
jgi:hypothetical protein